MVFISLILTCVLIAENAEDQQKELLYEVALYGHLLVCLSAGLACGYLFYARKRKTCSDAKCTDALPI